MQIKELIQVIKPIIIKSNIPQEENLFSINKFVIDSRGVRKGDCFIPIKGEHTDGHYFIKNAFDNGAICSLASSSFNINQILPPKYHKSIIIIKTSGLNAIRKIAKENTKKYITKHIFAITGTSGKTTTKEILAFMIRSMNYSVFFPKGGLNGAIGTPLALANLNKQYEFAVLEFATAKFGEILSQTRVAKPNTAILITIGHAHTQFLKDINGVKKAKGEIFTKVQNAILPDILYKEYKSILPSNTLTFGYQDKADIKIGDIKITPNGTRGAIYYKDQIYTFVIPMYHVHILENIAASLGALIINKFIKESDIKKLTLKLKNFTPPAQRGVIRYFEYKNSKIIFADYTYNANEISIKNMVDTIKKINTTVPIILYMADVLELGKLEEQQHKKFALMINELKNRIKTIFLQGKLMKITYKKIKQLNSPIQIFYSQNPEELHNKLNNIITQHPKIFIWAIGSHGMKTWEVTNKWHEIN